ncbi:dipeptide/oligopeptide/nickel ABC transporter permease/ATP-binding protein [Frankia sp. CNm7]|nr:dipeptide/oligopeptide/nickel ABC transporter permease/ATP-binding protein [Frankia nepalensis]MBL7517363.1 dipeptide/oligopeptide/nickel ABC transporter permease/ATP-binding protein [Frankia nepalensis]
MMNKVDSSVFPALDPEAGPEVPRIARRVLHRMLRQPATVAAGAFVAAIMIAAVLAPVLAPYDPLSQDLRRALEGPGGDHWLGTDYLGRDVLSRLIFGARVAIQASLQTVAIALIVGVPLGLFAAYRSGWWDRVLMRLLDVADSIPGLVLAFAIIAVLGPGLTSAMIAVSIIFAMNYMRLSRALALGEREKLYIDAARVSGLTERNVLFRQMLPNMAGPLIVQSTIYMGTALLIEAALSFLGLGLDIGAPSWGGMLSGATQWQNQQPFLPWPPGLAITLTVLAYNLLGDGLRDALAGEGSIRGIRERRQARRLSSRPAASAAEIDGPQAERIALSIRGLSVAFPTDTGIVTVVDDVSLDVRRGEMLGLVGESGSGKTMTGRAALGLVPIPGLVTAGSVRVDGQEVVGSSEAELNNLRGGSISMIFQDPLVALSPVHTIGRQLTQAIRNHDHDLNASAVQDRAVELLEMVGIAEARTRLRDYPHQFSGGMAQRVVIAIALAGQPSVLIADEPTTALDVTTQRQVLDVLADLKDRLGMAVVLITHDLGVVADACDRAAVMYAGQIIEEGTVDEIFKEPRHPYTSALLAAVPTSAGGSGRLPTIPGRVPPMDALPTGCRFAPRCLHRRDVCKMGPIELTTGSRCIREDELSLPGTTPVLRKKS